MNVPEKKYRSGIRWSLAGSAGVAAFQFLQILVFARLAGPAAAGDYVMAATIVGFFAPIAEAGLGQAVVQAREIRGGQPATLAWVGLGLGIVVFLMVWVGSGWLAGWYGRPVLADMLSLMALSLLFMPFGAQCGGLLVRAMRFDATARIEIAAAAASFALTTTLAFMDWGAWAMAWGFLLRSGIAAGGNWWYARRLTAWDFRNRSSLRNIRDLLRFGFLNLSAHWIDFLANNLDKLIVGKWLGATALGFYHLAFSLCVIPTARIGFVMTRVAFPVFAGIHHAGARLQAFFQRTAQEIIAVLFPVYAGLALFSGEIINLLYGPDWQPAGILLTVFAIGGMVRTLNVVFPYLTRGIGKPQFLFGWMVVWTLAINVFLIVFLFLTPQAESAAWSRVAAKFTVEIGLLFWLARKCGVDFGPVLLFAVRLLMNLIPVALAVILTDYLAAGFWLALILKLLIFCGGLAWVAGRPAFRESLQGLIQTFRT